MIYFCLSGVMFLCFPSPHKWEEWEFCNWVHLSVSLSAGIAQNSCSLDWGPTLVLLMAWSSYTFIQFDNPDLVLSTVKGFVPSQTLFGSPS